MSNASNQARRAGLRESSGDGNLSCNRVINGVPALPQLEANDDDIQKLLRGTRVLKRKNSVKYSRPFTNVGRNCQMSLLRFHSRQQISPMLSLGVLNC